MTTSTRLGVAMMAMWVTLADAGIAHGIVLDQVDDFEDGTPQAWEEGVISPNPPVNVSNGGPGGVGDNYLQNSASGGAGAGSRQVMFNSLQWTGDYLASGVTVIEADMANFGASALSMRIAIQDGLGSRFGSTLSVALPADGVWHSVAFAVTAADLTLISGTSTVEAALSNVIQLRVLAAASGPAWQGDSIASTLGIDNIRATAVCPNDCSGNGTCSADVCLCDEGWSGDDCSLEAVPIPSLSGWAMVMLGSALLLSGLLVRQARLFASAR